MQVGRHQLWYAPVLFGAAGLLFLKSIVYAALLPVDSFGTFSQVTLIAATLIQFGGLGFQLLCHKVLPRMRAAGDLAGSRALVTRTIGVFTASILIATIFVLAASEWSGRARTSLWILAIVYSFTQFAFLVALIEIKSGMEFLRHATWSLARAVLVTLAGAACAYLTEDARVLIVCEVLVTGMIASILLRSRVALGSLHDVRAWLSQYAPQATRLMLLNGTVMLLYTIDRWTGLMVLSDRDFGILALGLVTITVFETLQSVVNVSAYPLMARYIASGDRSTAYDFAAKATVIVLGATVLFIVPFVAFLEWAISAFLPAYAEATLVIEFAVLAGALRLADFFSTFSILCDRERRLAGLVGLYLLILVSGIVLSIKVFGHRFTPQTLGIVTVLASVGNISISYRVARGARLAGGA